MSDEFDFKTPTRPEWFVKTKKAVAEFFGLSYATIANNARWLPAKEKKGYDLRKCVAARHQAWLRTGQYKVTGSGYSGVADEDRNSTDALAKLKLREDYRAKKLANDATEGKLVSRSEVARSCAGKVIQARDIWRSLARDIAGLVPEDQKAIVLDRVQGKVDQGLRILCDIGGEILGSRAHEDELLAMAEEIKKRRKRTKCS